MNYYAYRVVRNPAPLAKKWIRVMKMTTIILVISLMQVSAAGLAQNVSLSVKKAPLKKVLKDIGVQTGYSFIYDAEMIKSGKPVTVDINAAPLETVLEICFKNQTLGYEIKNHTIILKKKDASLTGIGSMAVQTIRGKVRDEKGNPMPGVVLRIKGSKDASLTDANGDFSIKADPGAILVASFIGYETQELTLGDRETLTITLAPSVQSLGDVVVIGYGTVKKSDLTGAVGSVSAQQLNAYPVPNPLLALQGKAQGVQVLQNSGAPGAGLTVRIRGGNSLLGDNEPLYVLDGVPLSGNPNAISTNDIESMELLKDASSTAIYGSRGSNGVVLITTKKGKEGKTKIGFDTYYAIQQVPKKIDVLNAKEFATLANIRAANDGVAPFFTAGEVNGFGEGTNWQDELFRSAPLQNYSVNASGGNQNTKYYVSANINNQDGIIVGSSLRRITLMANMDQQLSKKLKLSYNTLLSNTNNTLIDNDNGVKGSTVLSAILTAPATIAPKNADGTYTNAQAYSFSPNSLVNPLLLALERKNASNRNFIIAGANLAYEPVNNLVFKTSLGLESSFTRTDLYSPRILFTTPTGLANISENSYLNILNENTVAYSRTFNEKHSLSLLGGVTYQQNRAKGFNTGNVTGFLTDKIGTNDLASGSVPGVSQSSSSKWVLFSYLSRLNYSYDNKYLLTASLRSDGSSRFGEGHKWGYFPSVALAWRVNNENFLKNVSQLSNLKLRLSYGETGSTAVSPYQTLNTLTSYQVTLGNETYIGIAPSLTDLANPNLKWETTAQYNAGLDIGLLGNRLNLVTDFYVKKTRDLLASIPLATSLGYSATIGNLGNIQNTGFELGLDGTIIDKAVRWNLNGGISVNRSKVIKLAGGTDILTGTTPLPISATLNLIREGQPVGVFYGYLEDGLDDKGAIKYKDIDGKPGITAADRTIIGDPNAKFIYNLGSSVSYKNFNLDFQFQGTQGNDIYNVNLSAQANGFYLGENQLKDVLTNSWDPAHPDPNAKYPKISSGTKFLASDRYVEDGSFLKLRNIQLGYTLPLSKWNVSWAKSIQLYISGQNLLTFTKYSWYDPEINSRAGGNALAIGWDNTTYPNTKMYTGGIRATF